MLHWGEMGARWGVNRSVAQIHALLYLSPQPLTEVRSVLGPACDARDLRVDLTAGQLTAGGRIWPVAVAADVTEYVVHGLDDVGRTLRAESEITRYEQGHVVPAVAVG